jgi:hypothetical protein
LFTHFRIFFIADVAQVFGQLFFCGKKYIFILTKKGMATIWPFFRNSSCHPECNAESGGKMEMAFKQGKHPFSPLNLEFVRW